MENKRNFHAYYVAVGTLIFIGIFLRTLFYFYDRPFWLDEASIAINMLEKGYLDYFKPLERLQVAPPLSLVFSKLLLHIIPDYEMAFHFMPFVAGILSVLVFFKLAEKVLVRKISVIVALFMFAINYRLCYYAQEFKPYGLDVLAEYAILLSYFSLDFKNASVKKLIGFSLLYSIGMWFAHATLFAGTVVFLLVLIKSDMFKGFKIHWKTVGKYLALTLPFTLSFITLFLLQYLYNTNTEGFYTWWNKRGFFYKDFSNAVPLFNRNFNFFFTFSPLGRIAGYTLLGLGTVLCLKNIFKEKCFLIFMPIFLALFLSYMRLYPFGDRVVAYIIPAFILLMCKSLDILFISKWVRYPMTVFVLGIVFFASSAEAVNTYRSLILKEFYFEDAEKPLLLAKKLMKPGDVLFINSYNSPFTFYTKAHNLNFDDIFRSQKKRRVKTIAYHRQLHRRLRAGTRYFYVLYRPRRNKWQPIVSYAEKNPTFKKITDMHGNGLYIWTEQ